jgi:hypothetical protein
MSTDKLSAALKAVDWKKNIVNFLADTPAAEKVAKCNMRLAIWAKQLESADKGNPSICFIREMQIVGQHVAVLIGLSLYKPAAGSIRSLVEAALYYTYFRTHPAELETLARAEGFYLEKKDVIGFHKDHTSMFVERQSKLGLLQRLEKWYGEVSGLVHGQIPGAWVEHKSVAEIKTIKATQDLAINAFCEGEDIVHRLFLCTVAQGLWDSFSTQSKTSLLSGLSGEEKKVLKLDAA